MSSWYLTSSFHIISLPNLLFLKILIHQRVFHRRMKALIRHRTSPVFSRQESHTFFVRCPFVVQLLSSCCPVNDWTTTGQQLDNNWTTNEVGLVKCCKC